MWCLSGSQSAWTEQNQHLCILSLSSEARRGQLHRGTGREAGTAILQSPAACSARSLKLPSAADLTSFPAGLRCNVRGTEALWLYSLSTSPHHPRASVYLQPLLQLQTVRHHLTSGVKSPMWVKISLEVRPHLCPVLGTPELLMILQHHHLRQMRIWDH